MNIYAVPPLVSAVLFIVLGVFVFSNNPKSSTNRTFGLTCLTTFVWQFSWFILFNFGTESLSKIMVLVGYTGIIFIPLTFYHFFMAFLKRNQEKPIISAIYVLGTVFLFLNWFSKLFIRGYYKYFWGYYPKAGILHPVYLILLFALAGRAFYFLRQELIASKSSPLKYNQTKYLLCAMIIYTLASIDFAVNYGIEIYPIGFIFILISLGIVAYTIAKYRLMDITVALTRAGIFIVVYLFVLGIPFVLGYKYGQWQLATWVTVFLATSGPFIFLFLQRRTEARLLAEERHAHELLRQASKGMVRYRNMKELLGLINHITSKTLKLENAAVFLVEENSGNFNLAAVRQKSKYHYLEKLNSNDALVQKLSTMEEPLVYEEVKLKAQELKDKPDDPIHEIESQMQKLSAAVIVPALSKGRLLGFLVLGEKKSKRMYSPDDLATLWALSYQAALAIENARLYEKEKIWLAEQSKRQALGEMAPGASHPDLIHKNH